MTDCLNPITRALSTGRSDAVIILAMSKDSGSMSNRRFLNKIDSYCGVDPIQPWFS